MRISEIATAAGTTPRAVRHYHRLGLLPEPVRPDNGYRDYGMAELARLMRIRWLAENGLSLGAMAAVFAAEPGTSDTEDLRADLAALHDEISHRVAQLVRKKEGLGRMLATVDAGRALTALPVELADALDAARERADDLERSALNRERDLLEIIAISGDTPDEMFTWFARAISDTSARESYRRMLRGWEQLRGRAVEQCGELIGQVAHELAAGLRAADFDSLLASGAASGPDFSPAELVPDPAQRRAVLRAIELLTGHPDTRP
ncbi:MerR family transcriptional regulator [Nocardia sp. NBC_01329]|uniref:MerR family transcriptional regulator n=1 Tax=Nocardia sp. NBC_01329 TaxID=2903594 RepID=UPI002E1560AF|nr:MerR family transcriptional regulator [Nocardia sp. NBC_01329]